MMSTLDWQFMNFISIKIQYFQEKNKNRKQQFMNGISCSRNAGCRHFEQCLRCVSEFVLCFSDGSNDGYASWEPAVIQFKSGSEAAFAPSKVPSSAAHCYQQVWCCKLFLLLLNCRWNSDFGSVFKGWASLWNAILFPQYSDTVGWTTWSPACKKLDVGLLVMTSCSASCHQHLHHP